MRILHDIRFTLLAIPALAASYSISAREAVIYNNDERTLTYDVQLVQDVRPENLLNEAARIWRETEEGKVQLQSETVPNVPGLQFKQVGRSEPKQYQTSCIVPGKEATPEDLANAFDAYRDCISREIARYQLPAYANLSYEIYEREDATRVSLVTSHGIETAGAKATSGKDFHGQNFGIGFGFSVGNEDFIEEAGVIDGVVRVTKETTTEPRLILEYHKFVGGKSGKGLDRFKRGHGPFVAIATSGDDVLSGVGLGWMYGWKSSDPNESEGFSIGIGAILDRDVKTLADGFEEGQPPPGAETDVRFETKSRWSWLLFVTRTF